MMKLFSITIGLLCCVSITSLDAKIIQIPKISVHQTLITDSSRLHSSAPFLSADTFRAMCKHHVDEAAKFIDTHKIEYGDPIYLRHPYLDFFNKNVRPYIKVPYVLVVHNDIHKISSEYKSLLNHKKLLKCFGKNADKAAHPKLEPIPIGLACRYFKHGNIEILSQIIGIDLQSKYQKLLYLNFALGTHPSRSKVHKHFRNFHQIIKGSNENYTSYLTKIASCKFTPSPRGSGEDCHRTWEAMYLGTIPIVKSSFLDPLFDQLPVLIVKDFSIVTEEFLLNKWDQMKSKKYKLEKLYAPYWEKRINSFRKKQ